MKVVFTRRGVLAAVMAGPPAAIAVRTGWLRYQDNPLPLIVNPVLVEADGWVLDASDDANASPVDGA